MIQPGLSHLDELESRSIHILREAGHCIKRLCLLWSVGKDSTVLLWLARKAFFGRIPFPLVHIDTSYKLPEMIEVRDRLAREWKLELIVGINQSALDAGMSCEAGRLACCTALKTEALQRTLDGTGPRRVLGHDGSIREESAGEPFDGAIVGIRADEEGSRSKERVFSPRNHQGGWDVGEQPPELWDQYKTSFAKGTHVRVHPLLDWTEVKIWEYIERESIPLVDLYFDQGDGTRYRTLGCAPCTQSISSDATNASEIITDLRSSQTSERAGRSQDRADHYAMEKLRRAGYM